MTLPLFGPQRGPIIKLRWYQREACNAVVRDHKLFRAVMLVMATGLGKTACIGALVRHWVNQNGRVLALAHRDELVEQLHAEIERATGMVAYIEQGKLQAPSYARIVVASVQSLSVRRLDRFGDDFFSNIVVDECFRAGTMVDGRRIEHIRPGDYVSCVDHSTGNYTKRRVVRLFRKRSKNILRIRTGASTIDCTHNHPFFVRGKGYVAAENLKTGDMLCLRAHFRIPGIQLSATENDLRQDMPLSEAFIHDGEHQSETLLKENAEEQPDVEARVSGQDGGYIEGDEARSQEEGRERIWAHRSRVGGGKSAWLGYPSGRPDSSTERVRLPNTLQAGRGQPRHESLHRGGRRQSPIDGETGARRQEGPLLAWVGLDSVESIEPSSAEGDFVYNIEVEGCHTYFANDVLVHNCHHYVAKTYKRPLDRFPKAKVLGVTATPKRGDKRAMGRIFQHVSYEMNIDRAISLGYLVPVDGERVQVEEIHLSDVTIVKGDFQKAQLDILMLKAVEGIIKETLRIAPHRQGIGFFPGVASAQAACDRMNALKPNSSCIIHGGTDKDERRELVRKYKAHVFQYMFNCNIATEGFDAPSTDLIIGGRPTKSLGLYFQMIGRGTRPVPGVIDRFELEEQWAERRAAIAASDKPDLKILDFVGNSAAHDLSPISVEDMLGGSFTDKERSAAKKIRDDQRQAGEQVSSPEDALQEARERLQSLLNKVQSQVVSTVTKFDPFNAHGVQERPKHEPPKGQPVTEGQRRVLLKAGMTDEEVSRLNKRSASRAIDEVMARRSKGLCTLAHLKRLEQFGIEATEISFDRAQAAMRFLRGANPNMVDVDHLKGMLGI
jgi:superfamily II DNA or RNA helicase